MESHDIDKAANEYAERESAVFNHKSARAITSIQSKEGFIAGANWALQNQWQSVDDALPFHNTEVVVATEDDDYYYRAIAWYSPTESKWYSNDKLLDKSKIKYWMPIPKFKMKQ